VSRSKVSSPEGVRGTSRREFLKGAAGATAGIALANVLGACAKGADSTGSGTSQARPYVTHEADVVVVGGGLAGMAAARAAFKAGAKVIVVNKGRTGHSGNTGIAWGHALVTNEWCTDETCIPATVATAIDVSGVIDQELVMSVVQAVRTEPMVHFSEQSGVIMQRMEDGSLWGVPSDPVARAQAPFAMALDGKWRLTGQYMNRLGMEIHDRTMMVDVVLSPDGHIAGVVAVDLENGEAHLFRGKTVIMAIGGYHWAHGTTIGCPEDTGEAHAIFLKHGLPMKDLEFNQIDFQGIRPYGQRLDGPDQSWLEIACSPCIAGPFWETTTNKNDVAFMKPFFTSPELTSYIGATFEGAILCAAKEVVAGNGTPGDGSGNGLYRDLVAEDTSHNTIYTQVAEFLRNARAAFGKDYFDLKHYECVAESYGSCGMPNVNAKTMETDVPGLYWAGHVNTNFASTMAWGQGNVSGVEAAAKARETSISAYSPEDVAAALDRTYAWLEAPEFSDPIRPIVIQRKIQKMYSNHLLWIKDATGMQAALDEFLRIQSEDLPKMAVADRSRQWNRDWRNALETEGMLLMAIASAYGALARTETRPLHFRTDYPKLDNDKFLVHIWTSVSENGSWSTTTTPVNDVYISKSELLPMILPVDVNEPNLT